MLKPSTAGTLPHQAGFHKSTELTNARHACYAITIGSLLECGKPSP